MNSKDSLTGPVRIALSLLVAGAGGRLGKIICGQGCSGLAGELAGMIGGAIVGWRMGKNANSNEEPST